MENPDEQGPIDLHMETRYPRLITVKNEVEERKLLAELQERFQDHLETKPWEYIVLELLTDEDEPEAMLNRHGEAGWELVSVCQSGSMIRCFMKRRKEPSNV
jgi:hypothetical protein